MLKLARRRSLPLALLLAWVLLGAQLLGGWHRIAHAALPASDTQLLAAASADDPRAGFDHLRGGADCGLFDQLLLGATLGSSAPAALPAFVSCAEPPLPVAGIDVRASAWQRPAARAPPLGHSA